MGFGSRVKSLFIEFGINTKKITEGYNKLVGRTKEAGKEIGGTSKKLDNFASKLKKAFVTGAIAIGLKSIVSAAVDAQEIASKFGTVFKDESDKANIAMLELSKGYGLAKTTSMELLGATGDLLTGLGMNQKTALDLSLQTQKLAVDLASFTNYSGGASGASMALTKALLGERESIKSLGISIQEADVKQRLMKKGLNNLTGTALKSARAQVTLELATEQSKNAIGDYARTSGSAANVIRTIGERFRDFKVELGNTIVQDENFNNALGMTKDLFESESFKSSIASIVGLLANFLTNILGLIPALIELTDQGKRLQNQFSEQALDFEKSFDMFYEGLRKAGVGFDTLNNAINSLPDGDKINELGKKQAELNDIIEESNKIMANSQPIDIAYKGAKVKLAKSTKELNEITADRNYLLSQGIQHIIKNAEAYGITKDQIEKMRKSIRGEIADAEKEIAKKQENKGVTEKLNTTLKKTEETYKKLELAGSRKLLPWETHQSLKVQETIRKQEEFQSTLQGTERELDDLGTTGAWALDNIANRSEALEVETINLTRSFREFIDIASSAVGAFLSIGGAMDGLSGRTKDTIDVFGDLIGNLASGNYIGAIMDVVGNMDKLANSLWGVSDAGPTFEERINAASQELSGIAGISDIAAVNLANFHKAVEEGKYELDEYADFLRETNAGLQQMQQSDYQFWGAMAGGDLDEMNEGLDDYQAHLNEVAGMDAGAIGAAMGKSIGSLGDFLSQGAESQSEFNDQVNITLGIFANLIRSGASITEVLSTMGDSFDKLIESQEANKWAADDTFESLKEFRTLIKDNSELIKSVEGFNKVLELTASLGEISEDQFKSYASSTMTQYDKLIKAGFSQNQALVMMAPSLKILKEQAERYGLTLDDNTKKLIEQGENAGIFDDMADPLENIANILTGIFELLGGSADRLSNFSGELENAANAAGKATGDAATAGIKESLANVGIFDFDLASSMPAKLELDTTQLEKLLGPQGKGDLQDRLTIETGDKKMEININPQTLNTREFEKLVKNNPGLFNDILQGKR